MDKSRSPTQISVGEDNPDTSAVVAHRNVLSLGEALFAMRRSRTSYFDDYAASDGAFSALLAMFLDTAQGNATPIDRVVAAADVPLSTAIYILNVLIEADQVRRIGPPGDERYMLTVRAEQAMHRYIADHLDWVRTTARNLR